MENEILLQILSELKELKQGQTEINKRLAVLEIEQRETHNNLISLENNITPMINALYESRSDLYPRVEKLEYTVSKLKFGSDILRLVELIESKTNV